MARAYRKLLEINVTHSFYQSGICKDLEFIPTPETSLLFNNYRFIYKKTANGLQILFQIDQQKESIEPVIPFDQDFQFDFIINQKTPAFLNFTEIPFYNSKHQCLYFTNKNSDLASDILSVQDKVCAMDLFPVINKQWKYATNQEKDLEIKNNNDEVIYMIPDDVPPKSEIIIDLSEHKTGIYSIFENKIGKKALIVDNFFKNPHGIVQIKLTAENTRKIALDQEDTYKYTISFDSRKTYWKYKIIRKNMDVSHTIIKDLAEEVIFLEETLENADENLKIFVSQQKIPLKEKNNCSFKLLNNPPGINGERTLIEKLSCPDIMNLSINPNLEDAFFSQIFVHI